MASTVASGHQKADLTKVLTRVSDIVAERDKRGPQKLGFWGFRVLGNYYLGVIYGVIGFRGLGFKGLLRL